MMLPSSQALSAHSEHARLEREIADLSAEILERYEEVNILYRLFDSFREEFDERAILARLLFEASGSVHAGAGWIGLTGNEAPASGAARSGAAAASAPAEHAPSRSPAGMLVWTAAGSPPPSLNGQALRPWMDRTETPADALPGQHAGSAPRPLACAAVAEDQGAACAPAPSVVALAQRAVAENRILSLEREAGGGSEPVMAVPLPGKNVPLGALVLQKPRTEQAFSSGDLRLVAAVAAAGASVIENRRLGRQMKETERVKGEIEIARSIQRGLLPAEDPLVKGLQVAGLCRPAQDIGGDYFGYTHIAPGRFGITIADVSGHSIGAAIGMVMTRCLIQSEAHRTDSPARVAARVNDLLNRDLADPGMFVTAFLVVYDEGTGSFKFANAGHNPPLLYRASTGASVVLKGASLGLGIMPDTRYFDRAERLHAGDMLVLYTDGLTEARSPGGEMFGFERLEQAVAACGALGARPAVEALIEQVVAWRGSPEFLDDITLVVARKE